MSFTSPDRVWDAVNSMIDDAEPGARNRARINAVFNGNPPYTEQEAEENRVETNVNFLEGTNIIHRARSQFSNAFTKPARYFSVVLDYGPPYKRREWSAILTRHMQRIMKRSLKYHHVLKTTFGSVVLHGVGPVTWFRDKDWCPKAHGIDDVLVPPGTLTSLENLEYFAVYTTFTISQLMKATTGEVTDPGWNKTLVAAAIKDLKENTGQPNSTSDMDAHYKPEKWEEDWKENAGYWGSSATPVLKAYDFRYLDDGKWRRKIVIDKLSNQRLEGTNDILLYDGGKRSYGDSLEQLMHVHFADGAVVQPARWHSVRSLGYLLYAVCHLQNRLRCKFTDATFESMLWYFRNVSSGDEERIQKIDLHHLGLIPDGLSWVGPNERHTIDPNLMSLAMNQHRQLMAENSAHYVQDVESGSSREQTATEVIAKVNESNALLGSMLSDAYVSERFKDLEIARRFATLDTKECKQYRDLCMADGVPPEVFKHVDAWDVIVEKVMGAGNKTLEIAQSDRLMAVKDTAEVGPDARRDIVRMFVTANTDDPILASHIVPEEQNQVSSAQQYASLAWGTLIDAKPVFITEAINRPDYIETLMQFLAQDIQRIEASQANPPMARIQGLTNVIQHLQQQISIVSTDPGMEDEVKMWSDLLGNASNKVKGYLQRHMEQQQQQGGEIDAETQAKVQAMLLTADAKAKVSTEKAAQTMRHKELAFEAEQQRKNATTAADLRRQALETAVDIKAQDLKTRADIVTKAQVAKATAKNKPKPTKK